MCHSYVCGVYHCSVSEEKPILAFWKKIDLSKNWSTLSGPNQFQFWKLLHKLNFGHVMHENWFWKLNSGHISLICRKSIFKIEPRTSLVNIVFSKNLIVQFSFLYLVEILFILWIQCGIGVQICSYCTRDAVCLLKFERWWSDPTVCVSVQIIVMCPPCDG